MVNDKIAQTSEILPVLELCKKHNRPLVLFSLDLREDPASMMVYNNKSGSLKTAAVNIPWSGGMETETLKDIAAMTGATVVDNQHYLELKDVELEHFGSA